MLRYPTFVIIGAMRCGTTSLHAYLGHHPEVFMSPIKGPALFIDPDEPIRYPSKYASLAEKREHRSDDELIAMLTSGHAGEPHFGEATDLYTRFPAIGFNVARKMWLCNPDMKLLYLVRHPVARILSQFRFERGKPLNTPPSRFRDYLHLSQDAVDTSRYWMQLVRFLDAGFGRDQLAVIVLEELLQDPRREWTRICRFLNIRVVDPPPFAHLNATRASARQHRYDGVRMEELVQSLRPEVATLERFIGRQIDVWTFS